MIEFNKPPFIGTELEYIRQAAEENNKLCGDGPFTKKCSAWMQDNFNVKHAILTTSCTHALEMAAYLSEIQPGDEICFVYTCNYGNVCFHCRCLRSARSKNRLRGYPSGYNEHRRDQD